MLDTIKIIIFEYILGYVLQGFALVLGVYAFNRIRIGSRKLYLLGSIIVIIVSIYTKTLKTSFGVSIIMNLLILFIIPIVFLKVSSIKAVKSTLFITIILLVSEMLNLLILIIVFEKAEYISKMKIPLDKAIMALPGAFIFASTAVILYYFLAYRRKDEIKSDGTIST